MNYITNSHNDMFDLLDTILDTYTQEFLKRRCDTPCECACDTNYPINKTPEKFELPECTVVNNDLPQEEDEALDSYEIPPYTCPVVKQVIYKLKTVEKVKDKSCRTCKIPLKYPVLTTIVYFMDNTKVVVSNSKLDPIKIEKKTYVSRSGKTYEYTTASRESKEMGLMYAIMKRMFGHPDENGVYSSASVGKELGQIIRFSTDQTLDDVVKMAEYDAREKRRAEMKKMKSKNEMSLKP